MKDSSILLLPSGRQLQRYKNNVPQSPGLSRDMLHWMYQSAQKVKLTDAGRHGGLIHDEIKIQEDLVLKKDGSDVKLSGWVDTGEEAFNLSLLKSNGQTRKLATHVLQISFLGYTGFRFPLVHYPTDGIKASELHVIIWDIISELMCWNFNVDFILQDGGEQNREFMLMHFNSNPINDRFLCVQIANPDRKLAMFQDYSHNLKKLRNS